jgi:glutathione S-transferase
MKLYMHPISTTSRPILFFAADQNIKLDAQVVDLMKGEHMQPAFLAINPNAQVPVLDDDGFYLSESSAILKYIADKTNSPAYPKDLKTRARVNELMDWFNTGFNHALGYSLCYPQLFDHVKMPDANAQKLLLASGQQRANKFLAVLDKNILGKGNAYLTGDQITIADYFATGIVSLGEVIGCKYSDYPNVQRWLAKMKARPNWNAANGALAQWTEMAKGKEYITV